MKFDGKKLSIIGNYYIKFESRFLSEGNRNRLWLERPSEYARLSDINEVNASRSRVIGTFISGRSGHLGRFPGIIPKRVKRILKDGVILIEKFENHKGIEVREFAIMLENK